MDKERMTRTVDVFPDLGYYCDSCHAPLVCSFALGLVIIHSMEVSIFSFKSTHC